VSPPAGSGRRRDRGRKGPWPSRYDLAAAVDPDIGSPGKIDLAVQLRLLAHPRSPVRLSFRAVTLQAPAKPLLRVGFMDEDDAREAVEVFGAHAAHALDDEDASGLKNAGFPVALSDPVVAPISRRVACGKFGQDSADAGSRLPQPAPTRVQIVHVQQLRLAGECYPAREGGFAGSGGPVDGDHGDVTAARARLPGMRENNVHRGHGRSTR